MTTKPQAVSTTVGLVTTLQILPDGIREQRDMAMINDYFAKKNSWVVDGSGDTFGHYVSVIGNLLGSVNAADKPTFRLVRTVVKQGLPKSAFDRVKNVLATSSEQLARVTEIPTRTIARRERFKPNESERILRVASAFQKTLELFEDLDGARKWFIAPKSALGGLAPLECCDTDTGAAEVENLLGRIEEGVYS